jgi:hypothetical protein
MYAILSRTMPGFTLATIIIPVLLILLWLPKSTIVTAQTIQSFSLINTATKANLGRISNGTNIRLSDVGSVLTIQANVINVPSSTTTSIVFDLDSVQRFHVENSAPYILSGDKNGKVYFPSNALLQPGRHVLSATPYSQKQGSGLKGKKITIQFTTIPAVSVPTPNKATVRAPTKKTSRRPTKTPIRRRTKSPTRKPTKAPMRQITRIPTRKPTKAPIRPITRIPTRKPTNAPIRRITKSPTRKAPTRPVTRMPTQKPTKAPIRRTTKSPTRKPTKAPISVTGNVPIVQSKAPLQVSNNTSTRRPTSFPLHLPINAPAESPTTKVIAPSSNSIQSKTMRCGGAVNSGELASKICSRDLWDPTDDPTQHCYAYGGATDPCALHNNNDMNDGLFKNPSACMGKTFYLWDEPDTQGKNYTWAGVEWVKYATRFASEIQTMRARGVQFTSPLLRAGGNDIIAININTFYMACGPTCHDPKSPAYINANAVNAFVGPWNRPGINGCRDSADFITNEVKNYNINNIVGSRPWYVTNWSRLGTFNIYDQVDAMNVILQFFLTGSPIQRIYWFGATDYGGNSGNNTLTTPLITSNGSSISLGQIWAANCKLL